MRGAVAATSAAVVMVSCGDLGQKGTGFFITDEGHVLTNNHVVGKLSLVGGALVVNYSHQISVAYNGGIHAATMLTDPNHLPPFVYDYAILKIDVPHATPFLQRGDVAYVEVGDDVLCLGFPLDFNQLVATKGIVSSLVRRPSHLNALHQMDTVLTDALVQYGNSGGPMVHVPTERVIGINTLGHEYVGPIADTLRSWRNNPQAQAVPGMIAVMDYVLQFSQVGLNYAVSIDHALSDPASPI